MRLLFVIMACSLSAVSAQAQTWMTQTISFDDLKLVNRKGELAPELVLPDRYASKGVRIEIGPGYTLPDDKVEAAVNCVRSPNCSRFGALAAIHTNDILSSADYNYPSLLLRFPSGTELVQFKYVGYSALGDQTLYTFKVYGDDALTDLRYTSQDLFPTTSTVQYNERPFTSIIQGTRAILIETVRSDPAHPQFPPIYNEAVIDDLVFQTPPYEIKLARQSGTIEAANKYSENTTLAVSVVYPVGNPQAGQVVADFTGDVTLKELTGTAYYNGVDGATALPADVHLANGVGQIVLRSLSDTNMYPGPGAASVEATATDLVKHSTNPVTVNQWFDENNDGTIDWLAASAGAKLTCFKGRPGEVGVVASKASAILQLVQPDPQDTGLCGRTEGGPASSLPIRIAPICSLNGGPNSHRLNTNLGMSETVIHEARHAWQASEENRNVGTNNDGKASTPKNDDDPPPLGQFTSGDFLLEQVTYSSANVLLESVSGSGDSIYDIDPSNPSKPLGVRKKEDDAYPFGFSSEGQCP